MKLHSIAVVGSGSAGTMAALRGVLNNNDVLLFPGSAHHRKGSRAQWVSKVENIPGLHKYPRGISGPNKETLQWIAASPLASNLTVMKNLGVVKLEKLPEGHFRLEDDQGGEHFAHYVVLCTGVMDVQPMIQGSIEPIFPFANAQTADYCLRCDGHHTLGKRTAVIGHDSGAAWVAVMLFERYKNPAMRILTNGQEPKFDADVAKLTEKYGIHVHTSPIKSVDGDAKSGRLNGFHLESGEMYACEMAFVALGMMVYNELAKMVGATLDARGFVVTDAKGRASIPGLYAAGDLRAGAKKQIYTAQDHAVDSLDDINALIRRTRRSDGV